MRPVVALRRVIGACGQTWSVAGPKPEAEAYISFQLSEMPSRDQYLETDEIMTRTARKRISVITLVATGPVSWGGNHQRDAKRHTT